MLQEQNFADYHIHTPYCGHAQGKIIEYVESAIQKGIREICFTDHLGRYYLKESQKKRYWDWGMNELNLARYFLELEDISQTYKNEIAIKTGLEVDYIEGAEDILMPLITTHSFDYILGSIHCLPLFGWKHLSNYTVQDSWPVFKEYFRTAKAAVSSGIFSGLAHIDFIWRYSKWPDKKTNEIFAALEETAQAAALHDCAIEINSNGYLWSQIYNIRGGDPFNILMENIKKYNTPITIGSDAHKPEYIGKAFSDIAAVLKLKGIFHYCIYNKNAKVWRPVP